MELGVFLQWQLLDFAVENQNVGIFSQLKPRSCVVFLCGWLVIFSFSGGSSAISHQKCNVFCVSDTFNLIHFFRESHMSCVTTVNIKCLWCFLLIIQ